MGFIQTGIKKLEALKTSLESFKEDRHANVGGMMIAGIIAIVALVVIAILGSALLPGAVTAIVDTNTTTWSTGSISIWDSTPIFVVLGFLLIILAIALYVLKGIDG